MKPGIAPVLCCIPDDVEVRRRMADVVGIFLEPYADSVEAQCSECGCKVWVGPVQQMARRQHPEAAIVCILCGLPEVVLGAPVLALTNR